MFPPFPEEEAFLECKKITHALESGVARLEHITPKSDSRKSQGIMIGVLIAEDDEKNRVVLNTVSGISKRLVYLVHTDDAEEKRQKKGDCLKSALNWRTDFKEHLKSALKWRADFYLEFATQTRLLTDVSHSSAKRPFQHSRKLKFPAMSQIKEHIFVPPIVDAEKINAALSQNDKEIHILTEKINRLKNTRRLENGRFLEQSEDEKTYIEQRKKLTDESLLKVFSLYSFACADGSEKKLLEICTEKLPPTGTGDCCAPKLLDYAFRHGLTPLSMVEVFFGKDTNNKKSLYRYPPCDERCALILPEMLGIKIMYRDCDIVVLDKQSGVLSVPGRGPEKQDCIVNRLKRLFPSCIAQPSVHRLDMETSGLLVLAFTEEAHRALSRQFEMREVHKEYVALLDGKLSDEKATGEVTLFFRVDRDHRPRQIWDEEYGKRAVTQWQKIDDEDFTLSDGSKKIVSRVRFFPLTGRTHQLRLAAADKRGLNIPIIGDSLYGNQSSAVRLMLHAETLDFTHPSTGERMHFVCKAKF